MPITWITFLIGSLALIGTPFFSGFYSKDSIIEAVGLSHLPGAGFAYFAVVAGVFVTAFYTFRMYFLVFHGKERFGKSHHDHNGDHADEEVSADHHHGLAPGQKPHESPWVVTLPLILLAIPSVFIGYLTIEPILFGNYFKDAIYISAEHPGDGRAGRRVSWRICNGFACHIRVPVLDCLVRRADRVVVLYEAPGLPGRAAKAFPFHLYPAGQQILFRHVSTTGSLPAARAVRAVSCGNSAISS